MEQCYFLGAWDTHHYLKNLVSCVFKLKGRAQLSSAHCCGLHQKRPWKFSRTGSLLIKFLLVNLKEEMRSAVSISLAKVRLWLCFKSVFFLHSGIFEFLSQILVWKVTERKKIHPCWWAYARVPHVLPFCESLCFCREIFQACRQRNYKLLV